MLDVLGLSRDFAAKVTGAADPAGAAAKVWSGGRAAVVGTCGAEGCWYRGKDDAAPRRQPAFRVEALDPTGCGDVFHGAYASALARGLDLAERVRGAAQCQAPRRPGRDPHQGATLSQGVGLGVDRFRLCSWGRRNDSLFLTAWRMGL